MKPTESTASSSSPYASSKQRKEEEEKQDYYVNMGYAIRCLREEFPELFYREPTFDIYRFCSSSLIDCGFRLASGKYRKELEFMPVDEV